MTVGISSIPYGRGVSRYTANLVRSLLPQKNLDLSLYGSSFRQKKALQQFVSQLKHQPFNHSVIQSWPPSLLATLWQFGLNPISKQLPNLDVFHSWDWLQPPDKNLPLVSTIHDLAIIKYPETAHPQILKMHERAWKILRERQAEIIAVSNSTKADIIKYLEIPGSQIHVIYEALPTETVQTAENLTEEKYEQLKKKLKLEKPYLFFVGTREPRKNLAKLIKAWQPLAKDYELIIAGEAGWDETAGKQNSSSLIPNPQFSPRYLGRVSDEELVVLYSEAEVFCYPSLYEGFGLPILEAFYHGTPVITSNVGSMPEVAGNAAELVNPNSVEDIRAGIEKILNESKLKQQERLKKMIIRLHQFSWDKVARETVAVYHQAISKA